MPQKCQICVHLDPKRFQYFLSLSREYAKKENPFMCNSNAKWRVRIKRPHVLFVKVRVYWHFDIWKYLQKVFDTLHTKPEKKFKRLNVIFRTMTPGGKVPWWCDHFSSAIFKSICSIAFINRFSSIACSTRTVARWQMEQWLWKV